MLLAIIISILAVTLLLILGTLALRLFYFFRALNRITDRLTKAASTPRPLDDPLDRIATALSDISIDFTRLVDNLQRAPKRRQ